MFVQWNPWAHLARLEHAMDHRFGGRFDDISAATRTGQPSPTTDAARATWRPTVDVYEDGAKIELVADLPGVDEKDVEIAIDKNVLVVRGERRPAHKVDDEKVRRVERVFGPFSRTFTLPPSVDPEQVSAELKNGVLALTLPKRPAAQTRQIKVQAS